MSTQTQEPPLTPQIWPLGQVPPHDGACPITQVLAASTQTQDALLLEYPHVSPLGQVPPHPGASEIRHVWSSGTQPQKSPGESWPQTEPAGHVPLLQCPGRAHPGVVLVVVVVVGVIVVVGGGGAIVVLVVVGVRSQAVNPLDLQRRTYRCLHRRRGSPCCWHSSIAEAQ